MIRNIEIVFAYLESRICLHAFYSLFVCLVVICLLFAFAVVQSLNESQHQRRLTGTPTTFQ